MSLEDSGKGGILVQMESSRGYLKSLQVRLNPFLRDSGLTESPKTSEQVGFIHGIGLFRFIHTSKRLNQVHTRLISRQYPFVNKHTFPIFASKQYICGHPGGSRRPNPSCASMTRRSCPIWASHPAMAA